MLIVIIHLMEGEEAGAHTRAIGTITRREYNEFKNLWIEMDIIDPNFIYYNKSWEKYKMLITHIKNKLE